MIPKHLLREFIHVAVGFTGRLHAARLTRYHVEISDGLFLDWTAAVRGASPGETFKVWVWVKSARTGFEKVKKIVHIELPETRGDLESALVNEEALGKYVATELA